MISVKVSLFTEMPLPPFSGEAGDHQFGDFGSKARRLVEKDNIMRAAVIDAYLLTKEIMGHYAMKS